MKEDKKQTLLTKFENELTRDILPFWAVKGLDKDFGGLMDYLSREGIILSTDKGGWIQGRALWIYSTTYKTIDQDKKWLEAASTIAGFVKEKMIRKEDGRVWFEVTREGEGLTLRRYLFSEMFAAMGLAAYSEISEDKEALQMARNLFDLIENLNGKLPPKISTKVRPMKGHSYTMMIINLCQVMRTADPSQSERYNQIISAQIEELFSDFIATDGLLHETVTSDGKQTEGPEGRCINPGHVIETCWFLLEESEFQHDQILQDKTLALLRKHMEFGWDEKFGGLFSFLDSEGYTPAQIEWDMKYWWPQCEALYAVFLAHSLTGEEYWENWFDKIYEYIYSHYPDKEFGEWIGYLRRDGSVAVDLKGNHFKGPFHIPRMLILLIQRLKKSLKTKG